MTLESKRESRRLIINADDYGLTVGVSQGILDAHLKGVVSSTTVMVGSPYAPDAVRLALQAAPKLGMGLHLTLSGTGQSILPPAEIPSLVRPDGRFYPFEDWLLHYEQLEASEIERELTAQMECFLQLAGKPPDHLDGHHHAVYRHPAALRTLLDLAAQYHIPIRNLWSDRERDKAIIESLKGLAESAHETALTELTTLLDKTPLPVMPERFEESFYDATSTLGDLLLLLTNLPNGVTEIMCHPGYADATLDSDYTTQRDGEIKTLTHLSVREVIKSEGIELITFGDLQPT